VRAYRFLMVVLMLNALSVCVYAQVGNYEGRPVSAVDVVIEGTPADPLAQNEFKALLKISAGADYSAVGVRQSLHDLFASGRVASARVEIHL